MGFIEQISKTFGVEQAGRSAEKSPSSLIPDMSVDELYFYVNEMLVDGDLVAVMSPKVESRENRTRLFFTITVPNAISDALKIDLNGRVLQIYAPKKPSSMNNDSPSAYGVYINLPRLVEPESIKFELNYGVLSLIFKKS